MFKKFTCVLLAMGLVFTNFIPVLADDAPGDGGRITISDDDNYDPSEDDNYMDGVSADEEDDPDFVPNDSLNFIFDVTGYESVEIRRQGGVDDDNATSGEPVTVSNGGSLSASGGANIEISGIAGKFITIGTYDESGNKDDDSANTSRSAGAPAYFGLPNEDARIWIEISEAPNNNVNTEVLNPDGSVTNSAVGEVDVNAAVPKNFPKKGQVFKGYAVVTEGRYIYSGGHESWTAKVKPTSGWLMTYMKSGNISAYCESGAYYCGEEAGSKMTYKATVTKADPETGEIRATVRFYIRVPSSNPRWVSRGGYDFFLGHQVLKGYVSKSADQGKITLKKASGNPSVTDGNKMYSLSGAEYGLYDEDDNLVHIFVTDANGNGGTKTVKSGRYTLKELTAPRGYELSVKVHKLSVKTGKSATVNVTDVPKVEYPNKIVIKKDSETRLKEAQGNATLTGAEYTIEYYDAQLSENPGSAPKAVWKAKTDANGEINFQSATLIQGSAYVQNGKRAWPLGTYFISETKASLGYKIPFNRGYMVNVTSKDGINTVAGVNDLTEENKTTYQDIIKGGISAEKLERETRERTPLGSASFVGTSFEIYNDSSTYVMILEDGKLMKKNKGELVSTIVIESEGEVATTGARDLPYGDYLVKEVKVDEKTSHLLSDSLSRRVEIREDGKVYAISKDGDIKEPFENQVKRGDAQWTKLRESDKTRIPGIPFMIVSRTTGEAHVVVSDENGYVNSSSAWNPHSQNTNANDYILAKDENGMSIAEPLIGADGFVDSSALDMYAGIWFEYDRDGNRCQAVDDTLAALPYDEYDVVELPVPQNKGLVLFDSRVKDSAELTIRRHEVTLATRDIHNEDKPDEPKPEPKTPVIGTVLTDDDDSKEIAETDEVTLIDTIAYKGLDIGKTYIFRGMMMDKASGKPLLEEGEPVVGESEPFLVTSEDGFTEVEFSFSTRGLAGKELVAFETAYLVVGIDQDAPDDEERSSLGEYMEGEGGEKLFVAAEHRDLNNEAQTVVVKTSTPGRKIVKTGDGTQFGFSVIIFVFAAACLVVFIKHTRRQK